MAISDTVKGALIQGSATILVVALAAYGVVSQLSATRQLMS